jgi:hypothetical protein
MIRILEAIERASPFFSFIVGLGLSVLLFHRNIADYRALAMPVHTVTNTVVKSDGKCWRYRVEDATCETSR